MIDALLGPLGGILAAIVTAVGIWLAGRQSGKAKAETKAAQKAAKDTHTAIEVRNETDALDDPAVNSALGKWLRDK